MKNTITPFPVQMLQGVVLISMFFVMPARAQTPLTGSRVESLWQLEESKWEKKMLSITGSDAKTLSRFLEEEALAFYATRGDFFAKAATGEITERTAENYFNTLCPIYLNRFKGYATGTASKQFGPVPLPTAGACNPACDNINFQNGTLSAWSAYYAVNNSSATAYNITTITGGPVGSVTKAAGPDPNTGNDYQVNLITAGGSDPVAGALIPLTPPLGGNCTQIGDGPQNGHGVGQLEQKFIVTAANPLLTVQYAVVLENPSHVTTEQPFFQMQVLDQNGNPITSCGQYFVVSGSALPGFKGIYYPANADTVYCKPWATAFVPLSAYIGTCVTVKFQAADCALGGHFGYGYVACACGNLSISSSSPVFCNGQKYVTLTGPPGAASYTWSGPCIAGPSTTQAIHITCAGTYNLVASSTAGPSCTDTFKITIPPSSSGPIPIPSFTANEVCAGTPTQFSNTSTPAAGPGVKFYWDFYNSGSYVDSTTNPAWVYPAGGFYQVKLHEVSNGCGVDTLLRVAVDSLYSNSFPISSVTHTNTSSCSVCDGSASFTIKGFTGPSYVITNNFNSSTYTISSSGMVTSSGSAGTCGTSMTATTTGSSWNVNFQYAGCLCPGAYKFFIKSNQTSASSKCSAGRNADTLSFVVNTTGVNITTNITLSPATCGHANGGASVTGLGGTAPYTYTWTGGLTGSTQSGLAPGTYTVLVKDFAGCIGTTPLVIGNLAQIPVLVVPYFVKCAGAKNGSIKVTAAGGTGPYTYTWTPVVSSTDSASGLAPGVYSVVLHDALGCAGNTSAVIKEPKPLHDSIVSFANANCKQSKGHALAGALGGVPPLTYTWSNGTVGASDTALVPGTYTVTVSDVNSCTAVASLTITQPVLTSAASQTNAQCNGSATGQATAILSGGAAPYTYSWSPAPGAGQGSNQATGLSAGTYTCFVNDKNGCAATSTYTITAPPALQPTPLQTNVTCFGSATGSATLSLSGGTSPYTYAWAPVPGSGQGTAAAAGLLSGTYTCSYSDSKGCAGSWVYTITSPASALDMGLAVTDASCGNNTGKLTTTATGGTPAYVYSWTPGGASTVSLNGLAPGTYTCHLSDANGCQKTAVATVANLSAATLVLNNVKMATCSGSCTASASVSASGGSGPLSYMWSPAPGAGQGTASVSALCAGTYTCTVADTNGCKTTKQIVVTQPQSLTLNPSHQNVACYSQANGTAGLSVTGGTPQYTYTWSPAPTSGQGTAQATGLAGGTNYTCLVQDSNGCKASQVFAISQPTALSATLVMVPATCGQANGSATAQVSGGTGAYTYSWSPCSLYTALASPLAAGVYTCVVSDSAGCQHKDTISITNNGVLPVAQITTLGTFSFCAGTSLVLNAGGSGTYSWSTGAVTPSIPVNTAGTYSLTVTNSCGSATASQVVSILSLPHALLGGGGTVCSGDSIQLRASGGTAYSWSTGSTMPSVYVSVAGTYVVAVTNSCGTDTASVVVKSSAVTAAFAADTTIGTASLLVNFADHSSANAITWTWDFGDGTTSTGPNTSHVFQSPGTYTVGLTVTNAFGCSSKSFVTVFVKEISSWILVPNVFTPNGDGSNDLFLISSQGIETCNIKLYDRWGVLLAELFAPHEGWDGRTMGGQSATDGTYYYILSAKGMDGKQFHLNGFFMLLH